MWIIFATLTPFLYTVTNFIDKYILEKKIKDPTAATIFGSYVSGVIGIIILAINGFPIFETQQIVYLCIAGILLVLYLLPYYSALKLDDASRVVPMFQFIPVVVFLFSWIFLHETLTTIQFIGFLIIVLSGFILSSNKVNLEMLKPRPVLFFMLISSSMYAGMLILIRSVIRTEDFWVTMGYQMVGSALGATILLGIVGVNRFKKATKNLFSIIGIISVNNGIAITAQLSEGFALSLATTSLVSVVGGIQPLFLILIGYFLTRSYPHIIKEDISRRMLQKKIIIMCALLLGLYLVYFP